MLVNVWGAIKAAAVPSRAPNYVQWNYIPTCLVSQHFTHSVFASGHGKQRLTL
jgi:hypothetical protein